MACNKESDGLREPREGAQVGSVWLVFQLPKRFFSYMPVVTILDPCNCKDDQQVHECIGPGMETFEAVFK